MKLTSTPGLAYLRLIFSLVLVPTLGLSLRAGPWESLFDGKTLAGWAPLGGQAPYAVEQGTIVGSAIADTPNSFLVTTRTYGDFIFECEVIQEGGPTNSGIQFRSQSLPSYQNGRVHGYQFEIDPSPRAWTGGIYDESRRGWLYPGTLNPAAADLYQLGRWNHVRIEAIGTSLRTWVNGRPVAHVIDGLTREGFIALQVHSVGKQLDQVGRRIRWRNLRIQTTDLVASPSDPIPVRNLQPNDLSAAEKAAGWRLLWDGVSSAGWRGANQTGFPAQGWTVSGGELRSAATGVKPRGGDLVTEQSFSAFEVQFEFRLTSGANSGVKYFVTERPPTGSALGLEFQLLDDERHADAAMGAAGNRMLGSVYDLIPRGAALNGLGIAPRIGEWQHGRIVVHPDNHVEHWLNGVKLAEYTRGSPLFKSLIARSKFEKIAGFGLGEKGPILLQDHGDEVHFRSLKIRELR